MPRKTKQVGKGSLMSCEKDKGTESARKCSTNNSASSSKTVKSRSDSEEKLWSSIKRTLNKDAIAKIVSFVDTQNIPSNPIHHPAVQGLRKELRAIVATTTASSPFQKTFVVHHGNRDYTIDITIRENKVTYITFKGIPDAQRSSVVKPKILSTFSHALFMNPNGMEFITNIEVNKTLCSDDQERVFYAVIATLISSKRLFEKELARLEAIKVRLIGIQRPILSLRDRVRELFQA